MEGLRRNELVLSRGNLVVTTSLIVPGVKAIGRRQVDQMKKVDQVLESLCFWFQAMDSSSFFN